MKKVTSALLRTSTAPGFLISSLGRQGAERRRGLAGVGARERESGPAAHSQGDGDHVTGLSLV